MSDLAYLPGDATNQTAVRIQANSRISPGGPGYLVVWEDQRTVLAGYLTWPTYPLMGNLKDIYAARLDHNGNLLDENPIIISNASLNQWQPDVAWNGQNWLVVWMTMRSDWYFFEDIVVVRSFSDRWFVVWEVQVTHDNIISTVRGLFVTPDGQAQPHFAISTSGDADNPDVAIGNSRAFVVWDEYTTQDGKIRARLMNQDGSFVAGQFLISDAPNR